MPVSSVYWYFPLAGELVQRPRAWCPAETQAHPELSGKTTFGAVLGSCWSVHVHRTFNSMQCLVSRNLENEHIDSVPITCPHMNLDKEIGRIE